VKKATNVLNGEMWITSGSLADVAVVWAKAEDDQIRGFRWKRHAGLHVDVHGKWLRAGYFRLSFTDCAILRKIFFPASPVCAARSVAESGALRYWLGRAIGAAMAHDTALQHAETRKQFANKPIASHQLGRKSLRG
jgi:glutaryl-CoA dehydrogenase